MNTFEMNRRQALIVGGMGALSLSMPGMVMGTDKLDATVYKSARNICGVEVLPAAEFNAYTVLKQKRLVLTKAAFEALKK